ncbi:MAG: hypothetical protein RL277_1328 [Planctomycetota bacterium]|jgi:rhodanese-related sulfurtransferase
MSGPQRLTPLEFARRRAAGERLEVLDVRERSELAIAPFPGARWIPLGELPRRVEELDASLTWVCLCHHGVRSAQAAAFLAAQGFDPVWNLSGGIERWSLEVDPAIPRY